MYVKDEIIWKTKVYKEDNTKTGLKDKSLWGMNQRWVRMIWGCHKDVDEDPNLQGCHTSQHGRTSQKIDFQWYVVKNSGS
jgi:hypothetical protein